MSNPPVEVQAHGQSVWLDFIHRRSLESGEMRKWMDEFGVVGVTSNPSIFQKAIGESDDYDAAIAEMLDLDADAIYERLAVADIQRALDLFRPIYDATNKHDGYVSLEVSPLIANDTATTLAEAKRLFALVDRPNLMIKIPATPAGIPAIEDAIAAGINVNVTLIFSVDNYEQVAKAYIRGLEKRLAAGQDVSHIASVASFFVSRIDTMVDPMLQNNIRAAQGSSSDQVAVNNQLLGKVAIANAKIAYQRFMQLFYSDYFAKLWDAGAQVQRPLWASTGTKNPAYSDTLYVDTLIGKDTVNTLPPATLKAFKDHGSVSASLLENHEAAEAVMAQLASVNVSMEQVTHQLQVDGVAAFAEAFESLIKQVETKRVVLKTGVIHKQNLALGTYSDAVQDSLKDLNAERAAGRIWGHDGSFWKDHSATIAKIENRLGWLDVGQTMDRDRLTALQASVKNSDISHVVLLGMGGSSLAPEVLYQTFGRQPGFPEFLMLDSTNPASVLALEDAIDPQHALFLVSSKSGGTIETLSFFRHFYQMTGERGEQFIAITDPGSGLEALAKEKNFRDTFLNPADIGGRYSALSYFGLVPAALIGLDLERLWASAENMMGACGADVPGQLHPGLYLGAILGVLANQGRDKVTLLTSGAIRSFGGWVEQLIAESTGKEGVGILPVVGATVGNPHDYGSDRLFVYLRVEGEADNDNVDAGVRTLREAGHPRVTLYLPDRYALAGEFFRWEFATAVAGKILGINPFDEPNVTESKENTANLLAYFVEHGRLPETEAVLTEGSAALYTDDAMLRGLGELCLQYNYSTSDDMTNLLAALINSTRAGDYIALLAYLPMTPANQAAMEDLQRRLRHATRRAVTVGYGPRYLHSTGQFHKGGPNKGTFIQFTAATPDDCAIPGEVYTFETLAAAQAAGDLAALRGKACRAIRLHLTGGIEEGLKVLHQAIDMVGARQR